MPRPSTQRLAVRLTPDGLRQVRGGHPWVYDTSITSLSADGAPGDLAVVFDADRRFAAIGLYDPTSPIRIRILHTGRPTPVDTDFWQRRIAHAASRRQPLIDRGDTTGYRLIHGDNDGLSGLVVDRYGDTLVVKLYTPAWFAHLADLVDVLLAEQQPERIVLRWSRATATTGTHGLTEGVTIHGTAPNGPVLFTENGLTFEADVVHGHKTGHFLDQRDNRARFRALAKGATVLDVFACTGGFSVHAAAGGARSVHLVDASAPALDTARRNLAHNADLTANTTVRTTVGDAFEVLDALRARGQHYDLVIVDPPSFASNRAAVPRALAAYGRLIEAASELTRPGGVMVACSCSSRVEAGTFFELVHERASRPIIEIERTGHAIDHPIGFAFGAYLKAIFARVG